jgi:predicted nucleic acid-binding protein
MIVVCDTSPISGLIILEKLDLLYSLYNTVYIPQKVKIELLRIQDKKYDVEKFLNNNWVKIEAISKIELYNQFRISLDEGESEAITLAIELNANILLIDELKGRMEASKIGLNVVGLIGVLIESKVKQLIPSMKEMLDKLIQNHFWINPELYNKVLKLVNESVV